MRRATNATLEARMVERLATVDALHDRMRELHARRHDSDDAYVAYSDAFNAWLKAHRLYMRTVRAYAR